MLKTIMVLATYINPLRRRIACPCGFKHRNPKTMRAHLNTHPSDVIGSFDADGRVVF